MAAGVLDGAGAVVVAGAGSAAEVGWVREEVGATATVRGVESVGEGPGDVGVGVADVAPGGGVAVPVGEERSDWLFGAAAGPAGWSSLPARSANVPAIRRLVPAAASSSQLRRAP
ncbi:hypothetical protein, partial [Knoellia flava]|uniref:hypothetical protein n=1 Tax=Knoellia flava TaxID=913969 RepID=UPI0018DC0F6B